ncbi:MAG: homoserine O-acetyltransferase family protein [Pyrinomonadaceae bacterium]
MFETNLKFNGTFSLESGCSIKNLNLRINIFGELNSERSNGILVFHALTGSACVSDWWGSVLEQSLDTNRRAVICVNYPGSCYGSTSAREISSQLNSDNPSIPILTVRDIARANKLALDRLGITKLEVAMGGSVGGMLAMQFAIEYPEIAEQIIAIGAAPLSAQGLALNHLQREAISSGNLKLARKIAMISYKSPFLFQTRFGRKPNRNGENPADEFDARFDIAGYLDYQGEIFDERFEPESYEMISKAMDIFAPTSHDFAKIEADVSLVGISSDQLFPAQDIRNLNDTLLSLGVNSTYFEMDSDDGHDAFLSDTVRMNNVLNEIGLDRTRKCASTV